MSIVSLIAHPAVTAILIERDGSRMLVEHPLGPLWVLAKDWKEQA